MFSSQKLDHHIFNKSDKLKIFKAPKEIKPHSNKNKNVEMYKNDFKIFSKKIENNSIEKNIVEGLDQTNLDQLNIKLNSLSITKDSLESSLTNNHYSIEVKFLKNNYFSKKKLII